MAKGSSDVAGALRAIQLSEARWQAVLETARDAIISIDENGLLTLFNPMAERVFGYAADEVLGRNVNMLMPDPYAVEHDRYLQSYRDTGVAKAIGRIREVEARRKNGEVFPIELSVSEARIGDERIFTAIIRDVSERRRAEQQIATLQQEARQRERLADIGAITAKVVHDIGNPLAGLSMQAQLVLRRAETDRIREPAKRIVECARRLDHLIRGFNAFARDQKLNLKEIVLPGFLESIVNEWKPATRQVGITLGLDVDAGARLRADEEQLRRVLDNLIKNAIEAINRGPGSVRISGLSPKDETTILKVEDSGPGIAPDFDAFQLFETTKANGTGLGLAIARQIIVAHGGTIDYDSAEPHGTIFTIRLPARGPSLR